MSLWDRDFVDEEVQGYFEFASDNSGSFHFGYVHGQIEYRISIRDGKPSLEFSWGVNDESSAAQGRGWAVLDGSKINGMIFFHMGDESEFKAKKARPK